jgi:uracil-DNA glycosylase
MSIVTIGNDWDKLLRPSFESDWYQNLRQFLISEYTNETIYPDMYDIYNSIRTTSYENTKVVIIGQDPYHGPGQAHGYCFSVKPGVPLPPSLKNIFQEINNDLGIKTPNNGCLIPWAKQGVLLLNAILTVRKSSPLSHKGKGWEKLTDKIISLLNDREEPVIFLLWGAPARAKKELITNSRHYVLEAPHPSPLSAYAGFFGCKHFSKANSLLALLSKQPINWQIPDI